MGRDYIEDVFRYITGIKDLKIGCIVVLHTAGRNGSYNPHLHIIVMAGGIDPSTGRWINLPYFKYKRIMPKKWQWHLLNMVKGFDSSPEMLALVKKLWKKYRKGFVNNFKRGNVPKKMNHLIKYLAKYISKPSISITSILKCDFDKEEVIYKYKDHKTNKNVVTKCDFITFIGRLAQQILPKSFHRIRYYGLQHPSCYVSRANEISNGLKLSGINISNDSFIAYPVGNWKWSLDPRVCKYCGTHLELSKIWSKKYGIIYDFLLGLVPEPIPPPDKSGSYCSFEPIIEIENIGDQLEFLF